MPLIVAYTSNGRLFLKEGGAPAREVVSRFAEDARARALKRAERDGWKERRSESLFGGRALWGVADAPLVSARITGATRTAREGTLFYILQTDAVGGVFLFARGPEEEKRLFHKEGLHIADPDFHPRTLLMTFSMALPSGVSSVAVADPEGKTIERVTEGDSVDEAPSWLPEAPKTIVYHSAGIARTSDGSPVGLGPFELRRLDLHARKSETIVESRDFDFLQPHGTADGALLYIRRPYEPLQGRRPGLLGSMKDVALFPFRVLRAGFDFLNAFALAFSRKPLTTAGGPKIDGEKIHTLFIRGRAIDARRALRERPKEEAPSLVPSDWTLVRRDRSGAETTLAKGVAAFDAAEDGTIVYTNGSGIFTLRPGGEPARLEKSSLVDSVAVLES